MSGEFDNVPIKGLDKIPDKPSRELIEERPVPSPPEVPKLSAKESLQILKGFLLNEATGILQGNFGGWQLWVKIIIVLAIIAVVIFL